MKKGIRNKIYLVASILICFYLIPSCKKDDKTVPNSSVDIYIYTSEPSFLALNAVGGWVYITGGSKGIIVYRKSNTEFTALDRHCTYLPNTACSRVSVDSSNIIAVDTCCGSKFLITDGSVQNGPASMALKQYATSFDGSVLHIYN